MKTINGILLLVVFLFGATVGSLLTRESSVYAARGQGIIRMPAAVPVVPPMQYFGHGDTIVGELQQIDGVSCDGCTIAAHTLTYGGGAYAFRNTRLPSGFQVVFNGAAQNTLQFMIATGTMPQPPLPHAPPPGSATQTAKLEIKPQTNPLTFVSATLDKNP
jgi:hypothetical protein